MVQIVKKKKKGRPSKADLARRNSATDSPAAKSAETERNLRRSGRRRNVRYTFDFDDYIDEDFDYYDEDDDEDKERRERKLMLLLKLQNNGAESPPSGTRRVSHALTVSASSSDYGDGGKPSKKRKINGSDKIEDDDANNNDIVNDFNDNEVQTFGSNFFLIGSEE